MKVLFLSKGDLPDYQSDMILHGLISLFGEDVIDINQCWYLYKELKESFWNEKIPENGKAYGRGFTTTGLFDNGNIDRNNIEQRICDNDFDLIIYGSARRFTQYIDLVLKHYPKNKIIFIDGQDQTDINWSLVNKGWYFKRELIYDDPQLFPINFCIPEEKIFRGDAIKTVDTAAIIPGNKETYIYDSEYDYYKGYQDAYFGVTFKKGGWDCLRHYEIIMNKCLPFFPNIEFCPPRTMTKFPKKICSYSNSLIKSNDINEKIYWDIMNEMYLHLIENLTTKKVVTDLLNKIL